MQGSIKCQGEWKLEDAEKGRQQIVITSIPYGVDKGQLESAIGAIIEDRKVPQLLGLSNETNEKEGMRIVLEMKADADPAAVMAYLYKHTELQRNVSYNMTALVPSADGRTLVPKDELSLKEILQHFLDFRLATVRRRFEYQLRQLRKRIHILEGFEVIFDDLDRAIKIIRNSEGKADAAQKLMKAFNLDDDQTTAILDSQLYKIAQMEILRIREELKEKRKEAERIEGILKSEKKLWGVIKGEMEALSEQFGDRRKTRVASEEDILEFDEEAYIVRENTNVVITKDGWVKRVGKLASVESTRVREGDNVIAVVPGNTLDTVIFFADDGTAYTIRMNGLPASSGYGEPLAKFFKLADRVKIISAITTDPRFTPADEPAKKDVPGGPYVFVAASSGNVLRTPLASYRFESTKAGRRFAKLDEGDRIVHVQLVRDEDGVMLVSKDGRLIYFPLDEVNVLAGVGKGVMGLKLDDKDECLGGTLITSSNRLYQLAVETQSGKQMDFGGTSYQMVARGGKGHKPGERTKFAKVLPPAIELVNWEELEGGTAKVGSKKNGAGLFES